jgi:hypothetical protein
MKVSKRDCTDRYYLLQIWGFGIFLHHFHHDEPPTFHTHPWNGISFIFGKYLEHHLEKEPKISRFFNYISATIPHRVTLINGKPVWTLFIHGKRFNQWKVFDKSGKVLDTEPWRDTEGRTNYS